VDVPGHLVLTVVDTSASFTDPSGVLQVVDLRSRQVVASHDLGGQPDSIDLSPDGRSAAVAIENERDEDVNDGQLPQPPGGWLAVVDLTGRPQAWTVRRVALTGLAAVAPEDPEPEYVSVNRRNQAVVTLQENNHIAVVDAELPVTRGGSPVGYDAEGIASRRAGGFWLASEGDSEAITNLLVEVDTGGQVVREIGLPAAVEAGATSNGFEGVAVVRDPDGREQVWVAVQREWADNPPGQVTLARFTPATGTWGFVAYPSTRRRRAAGSGCPSSPPWTTTPCSSWSATTAAAKPPRSSASTGWSWTASPRSRPATRPGRWWASGWSWT
jgi:hypothetical protein